MRLFTLGIVFSAATAHARAQAELPYAVDAAFSTAVRFVAVDRGCKIVDKDDKAAYVSFECDKRRGALELIKLGDKKALRAQITLGEETLGMELRWLDLFSRKLREEHGTEPGTRPGTSLPNASAPAGKDEPQSPLPGK
jgi:hypothetical protein